MNTYFRRAVALLLSICMLLTFMPTALATETETKLSATSYAVRDLTIAPEENTANVIVDAADECTLIVALYALDGRMLNCGIADVSASGTIQVTVPSDRPDDFIVKAFLLENATNTPLCENFSARSDEILPDNPSDYMISDLTATGPTLTATVSTGRACTLFVELLDENDETNILSSATVKLPGGLDGEEILVSPNGTQSEHFIARAVLCNASGNALTETFVTRRYTTAQELFDAQTPADFPAEQVLNFDEDGFAVLAEGVSQIDAPVETIDGSNTYSFAVEEAPVIGEALILNVDGVSTPVKVGDVWENGDGTVTIVPDEETYVSDFYDIINISVYTDVEVPVAEMSESSLFAEHSKDKTWSKSQTFGPLTVTATATVGVTADIQYDPHIFTKDYIYIKATANADGSLNAVLTGETSDSNSIPLIDNAQIALGQTGLFANLSLDIPLSYSFEATGTATATFDAEMGFSYCSTDGNGFQTIKNHNFDTEAKLESSFDLRGGLALTLGIGLYNAILNTEVTGTAGVIIQGDSSATTKHEENAEKLHGCILCYDGDMRPYLTIEAALTYEISEDCKGDIARKTLLDWTNGELGKKEFYISVLNTSDSLFEGQIHFGWNNCPNYKYLVLINTKNSNGETITDIPLRIVNEDGEEKGSGSSQYQLYLYNGYYIATATFKGINYDQDFIISGAKSTVTVEQDKGVVSLTVTDALTGKPINAQASFSTSNGESKTISLGEDGYTSVALDPGTCTIDIAAEGYRNQSVTKTVENGHLCKVDIQLQSNDSIVETVELNGHTYQRFEDGMDWNDAKSYCEQSGGHLVTITSAEEQQVVQKLVSYGSQNQYWLGGYKNGDWTWVTGETWDYTYWAIGMPDNHDGNEGYLQMYRIPNPHRYNKDDAYKWNDITADNHIAGEEDFFTTEQSGFICEWDANFASLYTDVLSDNGSDREG